VPIGSCERAVKAAALVTSRIVILRRTGIFPSRTELGFVVLIILSGLPGVGKTSIARALALELGAVHVRIDEIEQTIRLSGRHEGPMDDAGYRAGYALAEEHLRLGRTVIADSVNPLSMTREAWRAVAARLQMKALDVEIICSDVDEHRRRVETRQADIDGFTLPTWTDVVGRHYEPWNGDRIVIDTARDELADSLAKIRVAIADLEINPRDM
jgi:predicted kinase